MDNIAAASLVRNARRVKAQIADLEAELNEITVTLAGLAGHESGRHTVIGVDNTDYSFTIRENNTYPADNFDLTPGQRKRCMTLKWDAKKAAALYPEQREAAKVTNGVSVVL